MKRFAMFSVMLVAVPLILICGNLQSGKSGMISGVVVDVKSGRPVVGVVVQIEGTQLGAVTDNLGRYTIINVPEGSYRVCAKSVGYIPTCVIQLRADSAATTTQDFRLMPTAVETQQIVTAPRDLLRIDETQNNQQLTEEKIQNLPTTTVQDNVAVPDGLGGVAGELQLRAGRGAHTYCVPLPTGCPPAHGGNTPPNGEPFDAMFFENYGVNPFVSTEDDHLSTFAVDVDNASYAMSRSYLNSGHLPSKDAVRVEEFVNNFRYNYVHPQERAFSIALERAPSRFGNNYQLLKVGIVGKKIEPRDRKDANLVFIVDVSGSMGREDRLGTVRRALRMLVDNLTPRDRVGIVVYGSNAYELLEPTSIHDEDRIIAAIERLYPSGATNAEEGIRLGYRMADRIFERGKINRIILCSDGVANVGVTGADDLLKEIRQYADRGITLSAIGFGMGNFNDVLLEKLGDKGNGHYAYVDTWDEAKRVFLENLTGTLQVIARDVKIQVDFNSNVVDRYRLLGYENRDVDDDKFRDDKEDGGEIGSGHQVTALYEIKLKDGATGDLGTIFVRFKDPDNFEVTEVSERIGRKVFRSTFDAASSDFRLAAAAAEFSEILRKSYWAKGSKLSKVLDVARAVERETSDSHVIELMDLIAKADKLMKPDETPVEPLGME